MTDTQKSTHQMVEHLHSRFSTLEERLELLREDHTGLKVEVGELSEQLAEVRTWVSVHEQTALLKLESLWDGLARVELKFDRHVEREEKDRRWLMGLMWATLASAFGGLLTMWLRATGVA